MTMEATKFAVSRALADIAAALNQFIVSNCRQEFPFFLMAIHHGNQGHYIATAPVEVCSAGITDLIGRWKSNQPRPACRAGDLASSMLNLILLIPAVYTFVKAAFKIVTPEQVDFILVVMTDYGPNYVSSIDCRDTAAQLLTEQIAVWQQSLADEPARMPATAPAHLH